MFLIVGLGNPGSKYENNRHNIGFLAVQEILRRYSFSDFREKFKGLYTAGDIAGHKVHLLLPQTYMNLSGESVQAAAQFFKIKPEHIIVLHDELDLPPLKVKIKKGGGNGGHNGLKSIQQQLGTPDFKRIRIGIGHPGSKELVSPYVLADFSKAEKPDFERLNEDLADVIPWLLKEGEAKASSELARMRHS